MVGRTSQLHWYVFLAQTGIETSVALWEGVPLSTSIMLAGLTGHVGLPPMYSAMRNQART